MVKKNSEILRQITIRFAGDSGDGMQLTGTQFTTTTAVLGNDVSTLPDYPAEIRAPAGTVFGVSGFQLQFGNHKIHTPGFICDVLVAMNPAALKANLRNLKKNGIIIANKDAFTERNLKLSQQTSNPLDDGTLEGYQLFTVPITTLTKQALIESPLTSKEKERSKNFFALGISYWLFTRPLEVTLKWIDEKFKKQLELADANKKALNAGYAYALSAELFPTSFMVEKAEYAPGIYRNITGNEATVLGLITAARKAGLELFYGGYPITPASDILHHLAKYKNFDVKTFQAEDEIAGVGAAIGAAFAGALGVTASSGPGIALKGEFIGYAVITELPLVIVDVQRGGPSTGLPTKTEQTDLFQAVMGRNGEAPLPVIAAQSPADCFDAAYDAVRIALKFATPVILLTDGYIANGTEPWKIPDANDIPAISMRHAQTGDDYQPYKRDPKTLARTMAIPGTPGLEHRLGGLEKEDVTGNVSYDPDNHHKMTVLRAGKVARVADAIGPTKIYGADEGELLLISWGGTYGAVYNAFEAAMANNWKVSWIHLRWVSPFPHELVKIIHNFKKVLVPEINMGQLLKLLRAEYLVDAKGMNKVRGLPLNSNDIVAAIKDLLENE